MNLQLFPLPRGRIASDGAAYTFAEFVMHYGWEKGFANWQQAECGDSVEQHASTPAASQLTYIFCERHVVGFQKLTSFNRAFTVDLNDSAEAK